MSGFICSSRALQLVEARIESVVPHMVEVDSAQHREGPDQWDLHAEHWFQAHVLAHVEGIAHHGQHGREGHKARATSLQVLESARANPLHKDTKKWKTCQAQYVIPYRWHTFFIKPVGNCILIAHLECHQAEPAPSHPAFASLAEKKHPIASLRCMVVSWQRSQVCNVPAIR